MIVAGGVYVESCVTPASVQLLGSGGRAALALSGLRENLQLHTFHPTPESSDIAANFAPFGIECVTHDSPTRVHFSYLFPLSSPRISPFPVPQANRVDVVGDQVLRFGCIEGDFRVEAGSAIYDPQGAEGAALFRANGSRAERLAIVLNANEARALTGTDDLGEAASGLITSDGAAVIVVKDGPAGALVVEESGRADRVPAYECASLYKIGSGDVFTAAFAHSWLAGLGPIEAAHLASRYTAFYVETRQLPLPAHPPVKNVRGVRTSTDVHVAGDLRTTAGRWFVNEIGQALASIGARVASLQDIDQLIDEGLREPRDNNADALLVLAARGEPIPFARIREAIGSDRPAIAFTEDGFQVGVPGSETFVVTADLTRALYEVRWGQS